MKEEKHADPIVEAFAQKSWHEIHTTDSWRVFKIISELVGAALTKENLVSASLGVSNGGVQ